MTNMTGEYGCLVGSNTPYSDAEKCITSNKINYDAEKGILGYRPVLEKKDNILKMDDYRKVTGDYVSLQKQQDMYNPLRKVA